MKNIILAFLLCFSSSIFAYSTVPNSVQVQSTQTISCSDIPVEVLQNFYQSFIYIDGNLRGAYIGEIKNYASQDEIAGLMGLAAPDIDWQGYKPKGKRGCKRKQDWVCTTSTQIPSSGN